MKAEHAPCQARPAGLVHQLSSMLTIGLPSMVSLLSSVMKPEERHPHKENSPLRVIGTRQTSIRLGTRSVLASAVRPGGCQRDVPAPRTARGEPGRCLTDPGPSAMKLHPVFRGVHDIRCHDLARGCRNSAILANECIPCLYLVTSA